MKRIGACLAACALAALVVVSVGGAAPQVKGVWGTIFDARPASEQVERGILPIVNDSKALRQSLEASAGTPAVVGDKRKWIGLDDFYGSYYGKNFVLRALGAHAEIWVASDDVVQAPAFPGPPNAGSSSGVNFLAGDCRNGTRTEISDAQVAYLLNQFDNTMYPKESSAFSVPPSRDGSGTVLPPSYDPTGDGGRIVVLVDNVRDDNFYDKNNTNGNSYIAGFFSGQLNELFDRNVMTIDGFDWLHRTGANPPDNPVPGDNCASAPARPFLYEGTFAHEYQHLLENYEDPDEYSWINEGLSDWAQTLTGYVTPWKPVTDKGFDSHIQCFLGWLSVATPANPNPRAACGPENSLTRWGDQGDGEILADYGAAYSLMEMLQSRYGNSFMSTLHKGDDNGLVGLQAALDSLPQRGKSSSRGKGRHGKVLAQDVLHDWSIMVAVDGLLDKGYRLDWQLSRRSFQTKTLNATINWDNPNTYDTPGAPSNGADYVRLRNGSGGYLTGRDISSLGFAGSTMLPTTPVAWTVDSAPPFAVDGPALFSGADNDRDEAIVKQVTVPTGANAVLKFDALWNEEETWDFGFAQISTDGGATYTSVACTDTRSDTDPGALPTAVENVPGFTGASGAFEPQTCDLSAYAGQTVLLAFRAFNDPGTLGTDPAYPPGFWVDNVVVGSTLISNGTDLTGWKSFTEVRPNTVAGFTVRILSINSKRKTITVRSLRLNSSFTLRGNRVWPYIDRNADFVAAVVFYDDPSERSIQYAPYQLTVNGVTQPGGS